MKSHSQLSTEHGEMMYFIIWTTRIKYHKKYPGVKAIMITLSITRHVYCTFMQYLHT